MRVPRECYQIDEQLVGMLPQLRPAHRLNLALWIYGPILAGSATQHAVLTALAVYGRWHTMRDRLREWLYDGQERHAPCHTTLDVTTCFAPPAALAPGSVAGRGPPAGAGCDLSEG